MVLVTAIVTVPAVAKAPVVPLARARVATAPPAAKAVTRPPVSAVAQGVAPTAAARRAAEATWR